MTKRQTKLLVALGAANAATETCKTDRSSQLHMIVCVINPVHCAYLVK